MKKIISFVFLFVSLNVLAFDSEYLRCFGDSSGWAGESYSFKKLSNGKVFGVKLKQRLFWRDSYTPIFEATIQNNENGSITYFNKNAGVDITVYVDDYSGTLVAEGYDPEISILGHLLCEELDQESFYYFHVDPASSSNESIDLENITKLYRL